MYLPYLKDVEKFKDVISKIQETCKEYNISKYSGYMNKEFIKEIKPYIIYLCMVEGDGYHGYMFTYRFISERIMGLYPSDFYRCIVKPVKIRRLFDKSSKSRITKEKYKDELIAEISKNKILYKNKNDFIEESDHLIVQLILLHMITDDEVIKITGINNTKLKNIFEKYGINYEKRCLNENIRTGNDL